MMLIAGAIGQVCASIFKAQLSYAATMRLAAIAMTPGILLDTVTGLLRMPSYGCFGFILGIGLSLVFMGLAVKANAPERPKCARFCWPETGQMQGLLIACLGPELSAG